MIPRLGWRSVASRWHKHIGGPLVLRKITEWRNYSTPAVGVNARRKGGTFSMGYFTLSQQRRNRVDLDQQLIAE